MLHELSFTDRAILASTAMDMVVDNGHPDDFNTLRSVCWHKFRTDDKYDTADLVLAVRSIRATGAFHA